MSLYKHVSNNNCKLSGSCIYSSGENYAFLEKENLISYIPPHGTYKGGPEGFSYIKEGNYWLCPQGKKATYRVRRAEKGNWKDYYLTRRSDCKGCPIKKQCIGKSFEKRIGITIYVDEYTRNNQRVRSKFGRAMKSKRQSTVEPVWGTLTQFMGLRKVNTIGIEQANKVMHMAACAYNLKKMLKFEQRIIKTKAKAAILFFSRILFAIRVSKSPVKPVFITDINYGKW